MPRLISDVHFRLLALAPRVYFHAGGESMAAPCMNRSLAPNHGSRTVRQRDVSMIKYCIYEKSVLFNYTGIAV